MYTWHVIKEMLSRHVESRQGFGTKVSLICVYMYDIIVAGWDGGKKGYSEIRREDCIVRSDVTRTYTNLEVTKCK